MVRTSEPVPRHRSPRTPDPKQSFHSDVLSTERAGQPSQRQLTQGSAQLEQAPGKQRAIMARELA